MQSFAQLSTRSVAVCRHQFHRRKSRFRSRSHRWADWRSLNRTQNLCKGKLFSAESRKLFNHIKVGTSISRGLAMRLAWKSFKALSGSTTAFWLTRASSKSMCLVHHSIRSWCQKSSDQVLLTRNVSNLTKLFCARNTVLSVPDP